MREVVVPTGWVTSKGMLNMWTTHNIAAYSLIWLAAIAVPVQSLPASPYGCASGGSCSQNKRQSNSCCSAKKTRDDQYCSRHDKATATKTCCGKPRDEQDSPCNCRVNCQCGQSRQPKPVTPPVVNNAPEKVANSPVSMVTIHQPQATQKRRDESTAADALSALDSCVSLCRFTL